MTSHNKLPVIPTSEHHELVLLLKHALPSDMRKTWYSTFELEELLVRGGFSLPNVFVSKALRFHADSVLFIKNKFNNKIFYCFDDNPIFDTPKKQFNNNHPFDVRIIHPNHFRTVDLKWLRKYLTGPVTQSTHPHLNEALQGILPEQATTSMPAPAPCVAAPWAPA